MMDLFDLVSDTIEVEQKEWMKKFLFKAITTEEEMVELVDLCIKNGLYSLDLETNGLDTRVFNGETRAKIVGICISPDDKSGYYIPVRHQEGTNMPYSVVTKEMLRLTGSDARAIFHNAKFDQELLEFNGAEPWGRWTKVNKWEDTIILSYLTNSRRRKIGLKHMSRTELGMEMIELHELFGHEKAKKNFNYDFSTLDPREDAVLWYAAGDAICTYLLFQKLHPLVDKPKNNERKQRLVYVIEKSCSVATRWMERCRVHIDLEKVMELIAIGQKELFESLKGVYDMASDMLGRDITPLYFYMLQKKIETENPLFEIADHLPSLKDLLESCKSDAKIPMLVNRDKFLREKSGRTVHEDKRGVWPVEYDIMSSQQLGKMLDELQVPHLQRTEASNQIKTSKGALEDVLEKAGKKYPWLAKIKRFRETQKALSTYLYPLWEDRDVNDSTIKVNFNGVNTDTGRFSVKSGDFKKDGGCRIPFHGLPSTYDASRPECMGRIRECITARKGKFIVAIDFSGEELRIVTNMSGEVKWLNEFFRCSSCDTKFDRGDGKSTPSAPPAFCPNCGSDKIGDIHTLTCISVYGPEVVKNPMFKALRGDAKATNFALSYGGSGKAVVRSIGCSEQEGHRIKDAFDKSYLGLADWWKSTKRYAKKHGFVKTAWGRVYPVPDINLPRKDPETGRSNWSFISKAERNAVNGPVQGTGADIIKIAMAKVYLHVLKREWLDKVYMIATMHDELVFEIDGDILEQAIEEIEFIMTSNNVILKKKWAVPFTTDVEIGTHWMVPWDLSKMRGGKKKWCGELKPFFKSAREMKEKEDEVEVEKSETVENEVGTPKVGTPKKAPFYKFELDELSMRLVYELGDKLRECLGDTPLILTHKGEPIPLNTKVKIDIPRFQALFEQ